MPTKVYLLFKPSHVIELDVHDKIKEVGFLQIENVSGVPIGFKSRGSGKDSMSLTPATGIIEPSSKERIEIVYRKQHKKGGSERLTIEAFPLDEKYTTEQDLSELNKRQRSAKNLQVQEFKVLYHADDWTAPPSGGEELFSLKKAEEREEAATTPPLASVERKRPQRNLTLGSAPREGSPPVRVVLAEVPVVQPAEDHTPPSHGHPRPVVLPLEEAGHPIHREEPHAHVSVKDEKPHVSVKDEKPHAGDKPIVPEPPAVHPAPVQQEHEPPLVAEEPLKHQSLEKPPSVKKPGLFSGLHEHKPPTVAEEPPKHQTLSKPPSVKQPSGPQEKEAHPPGGHHHHHPPSVLPVHVAARVGPDPDDLSFVSAVLEIPTPEDALEVLPTAKPPSPPKHAAVDVDEVGPGLSESRFPMARKLMSKFSHLGDMVKKVVSETDKFRENQKFTMIMFWLVLALLLTLFGFLVVAPLWHHHHKKFHLGFHTPAPAAGALGTLVDTVSNAAADISEIVVEDGKAETFDTFLHDRMN